MTRREMEDLEEVAYLKNWITSKQLKKQKRLEFIKKLLKIQK